MKKLAVIAAGTGVVTLGLYGGVNLYATKTAEAKIDEFIAEVNDEFVIEYGSVNPSLLRSNVTVNDVRITPVDQPEQGVTVDRIVVRQFEHEADFPIAVDASLRGIQFISMPTAVPAFLAEMPQTGYAAAPSFNLDTKYDYSKSSQEASLEQFRIGADDLGYLDVTLKVSNVAPDAIDSDPMLHSAQIVYSDRSFAETWLATLASQNNQDVAQFKTELANNLSQAAQFFLSPSDPATMGMVQEAAAFIENPKGFTLAIAPQQPVRMSDLAAVGGPQAWVTLLNLNIEAH